MTKPNFLFLIALLTTVIISTSCKNITKRHASLISRFRSNPFVINAFRYGVGSNFFGRRQVQSHYHPVRYCNTHRHQASHPRYWTIRQWNKVNNEENEETNRYPATSYSNNDASRGEVPTKISQPTENEEKGSQDSEVYQNFNTLPFYERGQIFASEEEINNKPKLVKENVEEEIEDNEDVGPLFSSLPLYDVRIAFAPASETQDEAFTSSPLFEDDQVKSEDNKGSDVTVTVNEGEAPFTSFKKVENKFEKKGTNEESLVKFKDLPLFHVPDTFRVAPIAEDEQFDSVARNEDKSSLVESELNKKESVAFAPVEKVEALFTSFEKVNNKIKEKKKNEEIDVNFGDLPNFHVPETVQVEHQEPEVNPGNEERRKFSPRKNKSGLPDSDDQLHFGSLPNFDRRSSFRRPDDRFFFLPEHVEGSFGRRLSPKFRHVGELPLQHPTSAGLLDSYGKKL